MFYLDLFQALQKHEVRYVVVGGVAINLHGVERATMDADLVLAMDQANLQRFLKAASELALKPLLPVGIEALCDARVSQDSGDRALALAGRYLRADQYVSTGAGSAARAGGSGCREQCGLRFAEG